MGRAFSCIVTNNGKVFWEIGIDSHDDLISLFNINDNNDGIDYVKIEIIPNQNNDYPYLYPNDEWNLHIIDKVTRLSLEEEYKQTAWKAWATWKKQVYQFNLQEVLNPTNPFKMEKCVPLQQDILMLKEWVGIMSSFMQSNVGNSVGKSVFASVGASIGNEVLHSIRVRVSDIILAGVLASVGDNISPADKDNNIGLSLRDSVLAYSGSLFPNIKKWKYIIHEENKYPYQAAVDLWKRGLVASFDGKIWRLHSGKDASVVFETTRENLMAKK